MNRLEALLDAIASLKGASNPDSVAYQIRNPLLIKSFAKAGKHEIDDEGRRVFTSWLAGYKACLYDIEVKISGKSRAGLKENDKLANLLRVYGIGEKLGQQQVCKYLKRALKTDNISPDTDLSFFRS